MLDLLRPPEAAGLYVLMLPKDDGVGGDLGLAPPNSIGLEVSVPVARAPGVDGCLDCPKVEAVCLGIAPVSLSTTPKYAELVPLVAASAASRNALLAAPLFDPKGVGVVFCS